MESAGPRSSEVKFSRQKSENEQEEHLAFRDKLGVIVLAPDGRIVRIGRSLLEDSKLKMENEVIRKSTGEKPAESELVYRLFDKIPPYLYYTNKLDQNNVKSFDTPSNCKRYCSLISAFKNSVS